MTHFIERKHLLRWLAKNCTRKAVVRAMDEGSVELLGVFTALGPNNESGWIVKVTSEQLRVWYVEVIGSSKQYHRYRIFINEVVGNVLYQWQVSWENWAGYANVDYPLYGGDNPTEYARLRDERRKEITKRDQK